MSRSIQIVDGDSKIPLLPQLSDIGRIPTLSRPTFGLWLENLDPNPPFPGLKNNSVEIRVMINGCIAESGDGLHWLITGYVLTRSLRSISWLERLFNEVDMHNGSFVAMYETHHRKGMLRPGGIKVEF